MNVTALPNKIPGDAVPLERLNGNARLTESEKIAEASRQFEALLLRQILVETQKPLLNSKTADHSTASSIYRDMISNQLADCISKSGAVGLANSLEQQLGRQAKTDFPVETTTRAEAFLTTASARETTRLPLAQLPGSAPDASDSGPQYKSFRPHRS